MPETSLVVWSFYDQITRFRVYYFFFLCVLMRYTDFQSGSVQLRPTAVRVAPAWVGTMLRCGVCVPGRQGNLVTQPVHYDHLPPRTTGSEKLVEDVVVHGSHVDGYY
jgi:hypothetical protein